MNTEEVVAMIDAITEGKNTKIKWDGAALTGDLSIDSRVDSIRFAIKGDAFDIAHPRIAREIAGALVAWANRKEGWANNTSRAIEAMGYDPVAMQQVATFDVNMEANGNEVDDPSNPHPGKYHFHHNCQEC